jgi:hypothetical protein
VPVGDRRDLGEVRRLGEAAHREVGRVDTEHGRRAAVGQRRLEVIGAGPVGGPHLHQPRACPGHDLRDPDPAPDLDQLPARDDDGTATPGQPHREHQRRRVVGDNERRLGAGERHQVLLGGGVPRPAPAGGLVQLQVAMGRGGRDRRQPRRAGPRRPSEVRVQDHPGRVDDGRRDRQRRVIEVLEATDDRVGELGVRQRIRAAREPGALLVHDPPHDRGERRGLGHLRLCAHDREQPIDARRVGTE